MDAIVSPTTSKPDTRPSSEELTRISRRRAGRIVGVTLEIWRLRKPNKNGLQKARDLVKIVKCASAEAAQVALELKITEAQSREELADDE